MIWDFNVSSLLKDFELKNPPVIVVVNEFNDESAQMVREKYSMAQLSGQKVVPMIIDSYGGEVYSLLSILSTMRASRIPTATIVQGKAMSCGAFLCAFGTPGMRYADPNSAIMLHEISMGMFGKHSELTATKEHMDHLSSMTFDLLDEACNQEKGFFMNKIILKRSADYYMTAKDALDLRMIDHIGMPNFSVNIDVSLDFKK